MILTIESEPLPLLADADGVVRVGGTRITLETVIGAFREGATAEQIAARFDSLALADIYAAIGYYLKHVDEVEAYLNQREQAATQTRKALAGQSDGASIRQRLLARRTPTA